MPKGYAQPPAAGRPAGGRTARNFPQPARHCSDSPQFMTAARTWHGNCNICLQRNVRSSSGVGGPDTPQTSNDTPRPTTRTKTRDKSMVNRVSPRAAAGAAHRLTAGQAAVETAKAACPMTLAQIIGSTRTWARDSSFMDAPTAWVGNPPSSPRPGHPGPRGPRGGKRQAGHGNAVGRSAVPYHGAVEFFKRRNQ